MSLHETEIRSRLKRFLDRRSMPKFLEDKPQAISDELGAMTRAISRFAPRGDMSEWWSRFEADLGERNTTRSWPSEGEVSASCKAVTDRSGPRIAEQGSIDPYAINAKRIQNGEAVGDEWFYGRRAVELIEKGLATEGQLRPYRSALFFQMREVWGEDKAREKEAELIRRHEDAKSEGQRNQRGNLAIPDKRHAPEMFE